MCLYDYDSNVIWSHPIKSSDSADLIINRIKDCCKVLDKSNTTLTICLLDNKKSKISILFNKKKGLKHQIVTAHYH